MYPCLKLAVDLVEAGFIVVLIGVSLSEPHTSGLAGAVVVYIWYIRYMHILYVGLF